MYVTTWLQGLPVRSKRAPREIRRADLDGEPVRKILKRLLRTGELVLQGGARKSRLRCSLKRKEMVMPGIMTEGSARGSVPMRLTRSLWLNSLVRVGDS